MVLNFEIQISRPRLPDTTSIGRRPPTDRGPWLLRTLSTWMRPLRISNGSISPRTIRLPFLSGGGLQQRLPGRRTVVVPAQLEGGPLCPPFSESLSTETRNPRNLNFFFREFRVSVLNKQYLIVTNQTSDVTNSFAELAGSCEHPPDAVLFLLSERVRVSGGISVSKEYRIHPKIGVARVGNSPTDFYLGPEKNRRVARGVRSVRKSHHRGWTRCPRQEVQGCCRRDQTAGGAFQDL